MPAARHWPGQVWAQVE